MVLHKEVHYDCETPVGDSVTQVCEKLDLSAILQRAAMGIIDLDALQRRGSADLRGNVSDQSKEDLLNSPTTALDNIFGADRETVQKQLELHYETAMKNRKPKESSKVEPPKVEPPKVESPEVEPPKVEPHKE